ncbi:MAG: MFS transporter [Gammaproteobacteria bacterium]
MEDLSFTIQQRKTKTGTNSLILLPLSIFLLYDFIQLNMMGGMSSFIIDSAHINSVQFGFASSLFFYVNLALLPFSGPMLDKYQPRYLIALSILISAIGTWIFAMWPSYITLLTWRAMAGICGAFSYLSCVKIVGTYFSRHRIGVLLGLTGIVIMSAGLIDQYPMVTLLKQIGLISTLQINALFGVLVSMIVIMLIRKNTRHSTLIIEKNTTKTNPYSIFNNWLIALYAALTNFPLFVLGAVWGNLYLHTAYHLNISQAAILTSMIYAGNILGAPILGFLSDKHMHRKNFMIVSSLIFLVSLSLIIWLPASVPLSILYLCVFALGFATGAQTLAYASIVDINLPHNIAKAGSLLSFFSVGSGAICIPLFGLVSGVDKNYQHGMYIVVAAAIISLLLAIIYIPNRKGANLFRG